MWSGLGKEGVITPPQASAGTSSVPSPMAPPTGPPMGPPMGPPPTGPVVSDADESLLRELLRQVTVQSVPQLEILLEKDETMDAFSELSQEKVVMRWINYHLEKAGFIDHFSRPALTNISNPKAFCVLLHQLNASMCPTPNASIEVDPALLASHAIECAKAMGVDTKTQPGDLLTGNQRIALIFAAQVFISNHGLDGRAAAAPSSYASQVASTNTSELFSSFLDESSSNMFEGSPAAVQDGSAMLQRYKKSKQQRMSSLGDASMPPPTMPSLAPAQAQTPAQNRNSVPLAMDNNDGISPAANEGSALLRRYQQSKSKADSTGRLRDLSALDAVRKAYTAVMTMQEQGDVPTVSADLTEWLQGALDKLEQSEHSRLESSVRTPAVERKPVNSNSVMRNYMNNQLDLNQSETEFYETTINDLVDQLEKEKEEHDGLREQFESLEDDAKKNEELIESLESELAAKSEKILIDEQRLRELEEVRDALTIDLEGLREEKDRILEEKDVKVTQLLTESDDLKKEVEELLGRLAASDDRQAASREEAEEATEKVDIMEDRLADLEEQLSDSQAEVDSLSDELEKLRMNQQGSEMTVEESTAAAEAAAKLTAAQFEADIAILKTEVEDMKSTVHFKDDVIATLEARVEEDATKLVEMASKIDRLDELEAIAEESRRESEADLVEDVEALREQLLKAEAAIEEYREELREKDEETAMAEKALEEIQTQLEQRMIMGSEQHVSELEARLADANKTIEQFRGGKLDFSEEGDPGMTPSPAPLMQPPSTISTLSTSPKGEGNGKDVSKPDATGKMTELETEVNVLRDQLARAEAAIEDYREELDSKEEEVAMADRTLDEIQEQLAQRLILAGETEQAMTELEKKLIDAERLIEDYRQGRIEGRDEDGEGMSVQRSELEALKAELEIEVERLRAKLADAEAAVEEAKDEIASRDEEIAMADATLDEIQAQLAQRMLVAGESEMRMNELQAQLADSQKQIDAYRQGQIDMGDESARRNVELEGALREREEQLSVQATHVQSLQAAIEEQKNSYEMLQQKEIELKQHVDEMRDTIARLTEEAHSAEARFASDEEKLKLLQHELQIEAGHAAESDAALEETRTALKEAHQVADSLRETTSEQLLRIENLNSEVSAAHESPKEQLSKAWDRITELSSQLTDANHKAIEAKSELEQLALRERESSGRVSELQGEVDSLRTDYKATLGDLEALRTKETQDEASAQLQQLEQVREVEALKQQLEEKEEDLADLKGTLETVEQLLEEEQQKVAVEQDKLAQLTEEMTEANAASSSSKADLLSKVEALEESVASLTRENSEMTMEIEDSRLRIQDLEEDVQRLERELQAAMDDKDAQSIDFEREKSTRIDDFAKLNERLEQAEKQALDMSTDGAKAFARSSKTIAYLESECARLASLADHHKSVNIKLADDIRSMQEEGLRASGLEHRLKISDESEQQLRSELDKTLVSLTAKEAELLKYMEETQMIEMKRSEDVEKKLDALNERFKDTYDKHQSALKEIKTLKDTNDLAERNMMAEIGALRNELSSAETELQAKMRQLEDSEAMVKSLRSSLLDKDDYISETQSKLGLLRQDADYTKDALERRTIELQSELQEKVDQNCELENKLSSLKGQLADSETINIKKDESIATFLSKQAEMTEKNRELQSDIELKDCEINNLTAILEDTRKDLDEATERADSLQDEFDELQNDTHRKTLSDLAGVEAKLQFLQEEHRELDGQKQALASAKNDAEERCITSDAKCQALQESLATTDGKLHGAIANVNRLESENKQLLTQLEEITTKFSFTSQELSKMQSHLTESTNARESTDKRLHAVETRLEAAEKQIHAYESNEAHMLADMRVIGDVLSNDVDLKAHADGINTVSDFFTSPAASILSAASGVLSTPGVSRINSSASDEATTPGPLSIIQKHLVDVKSKANALAQINLSNEEKLKASKVEIASLKESLDRKSTETAALSLEKENFSARVSTLESDIANLRDSGYHMAQEREELFASADGFAQTVRGILRSLDGKIADSLARANAITAGRMTIKPDEEGALVEVSDDRVSPVDFGASSLLTSSASKVENAMASLCQALEMLVEDITVKKVALDETNARIHANEHASSSERQVLTDKINALEIRCNEEHTRYKESHSEMVKVRQELQSAKDSLGELAGSNADLELEYKHALDSNDDLQGLANRIEGDLHDLQSKLRAEKMDNDRKADEITQLSEHLQLARRKASEIELQLLRKDDVIERSKVEKDAIDSVRRSLEQELDRCRVDLQNQKAIARSAEEDKRASFEVEKLMAALSTTLDQVSASFTYGGSPPPNGSTGQHLEVTSTPLSDRVDMAIRRLGDLRGLCREEGRNRRAQEERIASLEVDLRDSAELADEVQAQFTQLQQGVSERENSWRLKIKDTEELHSTATRRQDEIHRLKSEVDELTDSLDEEKHYKQKLVSELQSKETELVHSRATLESANSNAAKLQEAVDGSRERLREKTMEVESISEQLRASKANNARLAATIDVLERGFDKEKAERDALSLRLKDAGSSSAEVHRLKQQVSNLQGDLEALKEKVKSATHAKHSSESKCAALEHEADTANMRLRSTETRLENLQRENRTLSEEVTHMRHKLTKANEYGDTEHAKYLRAEAALEAMSENVKPEIDNYTAIVNDVQAKLRMDDEDKNNLRNQLHTLKLAADQKDSQIGSLNSKTTSLEKEVHLVREKLQKARDEEEVAKNRSRALRHEGRRARSCILEAVTHMWEVTNTARTEARSAGVEIPSMLNHDSAVALKVSNTNESISETVGLEEALGVSELSKAVEAMREISQWIRDAPRSRIEMESSIKRLEIENTRLVKDITNTETKCEERVSRMRDEVNQLNKELGEFRRGEASHTQLTRHIANLEQTVKTERADKAKACGHADRLQDEVSNLTHELTLTKRELSSLKSAPQVKAGSSSDLSTLQKEMEVLRRETSTQAKEIKAVNHHRSVLRETVDGVEKQLRQMTDALADSQSMQRQLTGSENHELYDKSDEEESLRRMVSRYRARSLAMEELVAIYRAGILALYADGSSYGAANHAWTDDAQQDGLGVGWIEREINTVRRSYDEEVRILEAEVNELRGKLRQSNSFVTELRRRFEDNMRAMYRAGRDQGSEGLLTQFEHVSAALESSEAELDSLNQDLLYEKNQGRRRHTHLVSDLTKALQARDAAFAAVQRLETMCEEAGLGPLNVYEALKEDIRAMGSEEVAIDASFFEGAADRSRSRPYSRNTHHSRASNARQTPTKWERDDTPSKREDRELQRERQRLSERLKEEKLALALRGDRVRSAASPSRAITMGKATPAQFPMQARASPMTLTETKSTPGSVVYPLATVGAAAGSATLRVKKSTTSKSNDNLKSMR